MLDCYAALCAAQQYRVSRIYREETPNVKLQQAKNRVFKTAMSLMSAGMTHDDDEIPKKCNAVSTLIATGQCCDDTVFPDDSKIEDGRGWMPLHWAAIGFDTPEGDMHGLTEEDVHLVYASDPLALQRYHHHIDIDVEDQNDQYNCTDIERYTPVHFLCMQPVTPKRISLLQYFSICNRQARFIPSVLHVTCQLGQPTEELLKFLLQLDSSQTAKFYKEDRSNPLTPLGLLCCNKSCNERLITCLLEADSSPEVVIGGLFACIRPYDHTNILENLDVLFKSQESLGSRTMWDVEPLLLNRLMQSVICSSQLPPSLCIAVIQRILAIRPDVVKEVFNGRLPIHNATKHCALEVMEFLLELYPESAMVVTVDELWPDKGSDNLLHLALDTYNHTTKVTYLCSRYPEMIHQRNGSGKTPLHLSLGGYNASISTANILCDIGGQEVVKAPIIHPTKQCGWLPLHLMIKKINNAWCHDLSSPLSKGADVFRMLLRWYPEAAGIAAGSPGDLKTPYQLADEPSQTIDPYFLRPLLRAAPDLNPSELHRLNYAERRMAMFLAFRAAASDPTPLLLARLRFANKDLVKRVVSFL